MSRAKSGLDKNLSNVVKDLEKNPVNSLDAQQMERHKNDVRKNDAINHQHEVDMDVSH